MTFAHVVRKSHADLGQQVLHLGKHGNGLFAARGGEVWRLYTGQKAELRLRRLPHASDDTPLAIQRARARRNGKRQRHGRQFACAVREAKQWHIGGR